MNNEENNLSRNNHFLSKMYLDAWKNEKGKVMVYELLVPSNQIPMWQPKSTKSIGKYKSMFVRLKNKKETDDIEKWLNQKYETPAKKPLEKAVNDMNLKKEEWISLIDFIMCHLVRSPSFIIRILNLARNECTSIFKEECENLSFNIENKKEILKDNQNFFADLFPIKITDEGYIDKNIKNIKIETILGKQFYLWIMKYLLEKTTKILYKYKWGIITVDEKVKLPTTDNPVICVKFISQKKYTFNAELGKKNTIILFPISPNKIIYTKVGYNIKSKIKVDYETSNLIKKIIVENAYNIIISSQEDNDIEKNTPRIVDKEQFIAEKKMWDDFQKQYIEKEVNFIK